VAIKIPLNMVGDRGTNLRLKQSGSTNVQIGVGVDNTLVLYDATYPAGLRLEDILTGAIVGGTFLPSVRANIKIDVGLTRPSSIMRVDDGDGHLVDIGSDAPSGNSYWIIPIIGVPQPTSINLYINGLLYGPSTAYPSFTGIYTTGYWHIETARGSGVYVDLWGVRIDEPEVIYSSTYMVSYDKKLWDTSGLQVIRRNTVSYTFGALPVEVDECIEHTFSFNVAPILPEENPFYWPLADFLTLGDFDFYRNGLKEIPERLVFVLPDFTTDPLNHTIKIRIDNRNDDMSAFLVDGDTIIFSYPYLYTIVTP